MRKFKFLCINCSNLKGKEEVNLILQLPIYQKKNPSQIKRKALFTLRAKHLNSLMSKKYLNISIANV